MASVRRGVGDVVSIFEFLRTNPSAANRVSRAVIRLLSVTLRLGTSRRSLDQGYVDSLPGKLGISFANPFGCGCRDCLEQTLRVSVRTAEVEAARIER